MLIKKGDLVEVVAGDDRSRGGERTVGKVLRVMPDDNKLVVEGVNKVFKLIRPSQRNPKGGRLSKEMPINASNVLLYNAELGRGVRVGVKVNENGDKVRICRKTGKEMGVLRRAKASGGSTSN
ncbi:MAG: 50S ribosomal protein L24 [Planctomycetia bacterium]